MARVLFFALHKDSKAIDPLGSLAGNYELTNVADVLATIRWDED